MCMHAYACVCVFACVSLYVWVLGDQNNTREKKGYGANCDERAAAVPVRCPLVSREHRQRPHVPLPPWRECLAVPWGGRSVG